MRRRWSPKLVVLMASLAVVGVLIGTALRPGAGAVDANSPVDGDAELAAAALEQIPDAGIYALTVAEVTSEGIRVASIDAPLTGTFEIGSVTKGVTGLLYSDAVARNEVSASTQLSEIFDVPEGDAADITLEELAQHRSGLPRLPMNPGDLLRSSLMSLLAKNPYNSSAEDITSELVHATVGEKDPQYSNLGFAVLGESLAARTGLNYPELVQQRIAQPLGLDLFYVPVGGDAGLDENAVQGRDSQGRSQQAWTDSGYASAGGIRADAASMASLAEALLDGSAPGTEALEPTTDFDGNQIGAGWLTSEIEGSTIVWHNGGTGGFSSWFGLNYERGSAVFIAGATTSSLDEAGIALLQEAGQ